VNRVPTADDKVRLDANATIPADYVAYALKIVNSHDLVPLPSRTVVN
jgi:hypothetical protein